MAEIQRERIPGSRYDGAVLETRMKLEVYTHLSDRYILLLLYILTSIRHIPRTRSPTLLSHAGDNFDQTSCCSKDVLILRESRADALIGRLVSAGKIFRSSIDVDHVTHLHLKRVRQNAVCDKIEQCLVSV